MNVPSRKDSRGAVLIVVLWCVIILAIVVTNYAFLVRTETRIVANYADESHLETIASSGVEMAIAVLKEDTETPDTLREAWSNNEEAFGNQTIGEGVFNVVRYLRDGDAVNLVPGLEDEASKLNILTADLETLQKLPGVDPELAAALRDWQDNDSEPSPGGAEADTYAALEIPRPIRNKNLTSIEELLLVKGFDSAILYGEDWNRNGILDPNENDGDASMPPDNSDGILDLGLMPYITIYSKDKNEALDGKKRVNINTAGEAALKSGIPGLTDDEAKAIVAHRKEKKFENIGQLLLVVEKQETQAAAGNTNNSNGRSSGGNRRNRQRQAEPAPKDTSDEGKKVFSKKRLKEVVDYMTLSDETSLPGRVNLNTAPIPVLKALPGMTESIAANLVGSREEEEKTFRNIGELLDIDGVTEDIFMGLSEFVTVRSDQFRVTSRAEITGVPFRRTATAVLDRSEDSVKILYWNLR